MPESDAKTPSSNSGSDDATYVPSAGFGGEGTGGLNTAMPSSVPSQDLSGDKLLLSAPRVSLDQKAVPALGGIPLLAKLGQGGMGAVYYGIHPRLHLEVAVKVLPFNLAEQNPDLIQRFFREARIAASIQSPHLVGVKDVNEDSGLFYLVMEFVRGLSAGDYLRQLIQAGRRGLNESTALDICIAATTGLCTAHEKGVIHRDIKPDNIMLPFIEGTQEPQFVAGKLADLGLARSEGMDKSLTGSQSAMGTPGYMAPEQGMDAKAAAKPADVFSMGATLYALLSGNAPFTGSSLMKVLLDTANTPHQPVRTLRPDISTVTEELLARCLSKEPAQRYADAHALLQALKVCREAQGEPEATMKAIEQLTMLQNAAEVGAPVKAAPAPGPQGSSAFRPPAAAVPPSSLPEQTPAMPAPTPAPAQHGSSAPAQSGAGVLPWAITALVVVGAVIGFVLLPGSKSPELDPQTKPVAQAPAEPAKQKPAPEPAPEPEKVEQPEPASEPVEKVAPPPPQEPVPPIKKELTAEEQKALHEKALDAQTTAGVKRDQVIRVEAELKAALRNDPGNGVLKRLHDACQQHAFDGPLRVGADKNFKYGEAVMPNRDYEVATQKFKDALDGYREVLAFRNAAEKILQSEETYRMRAAAATKELDDDAKRLFAPVTSLLDQARAGVVAGKMPEAEAKLQAVAHAIDQAEALAEKRGEAMTVRHDAAVLAVLPAFKDELAKADSKLKEADQAGQAGTFAKARDGFINAQATYEGLIAAAGTKIGELLALAKDQHNRQQYEEARASLDLVLRIVPNHEGATKARDALNTDLKYEEHWAAGQKHLKDAQRLLALVEKGAAQAQDCATRFLFAIQSFDQALDIKNASNQAQEGKRQAILGQNQAHYLTAMSEAQALLINEPTDEQGYYGNLLDDKRARVEGALNRALAAKPQDSQAIKLREKLDVNQTNPLRGAKEGDWVEFKVTTRVQGMNDMPGTMRYTVSDVEGQTVTMKVITNLNGNKTEAKEVHNNSKKLGDSLENFASNLPKGTEVKMGQSGKETVFYEGKVYRCLWQDYHAEFPEDNDEGLVRATMRIWLSANAPVLGLVKLEMVTVVNNGEQFVNAHTIAYYSKHSKR